MAEDLTHITNIIESEIEDLDTKVRDIASQSQSRYRTHMQPGEALPEFGPFDAADDESREQVCDAESRTFHRVMDYIDMHMKEVRRSMAAPASADAVATVQLALSRDHIGEEELGALYDAYGSNYQLASAIRARAAKEHIIIPDAITATDRREAELRARRILGRHSSGEGLNAMGTPRRTAENIVDGWAHRDILGGTW